MPQPYLFLVILQCLCITFPLFAQWNTSFENNNELLSPLWTGQVGHFSVNAKQQLQLNNSNSTEKNKSTLLRTIHIGGKTQWNCTIQLDFAPSSNNHALFILQADRPVNTDFIYNGYYLKIGGESGSTDALELYKQQGDRAVLLWRGKDGQVGTSSINLTIQIKRDENARWTIATKKTNRTSFVTEGTVTDASFSMGFYTGWQCIYTKTRSDKFFFDNIQVQTTVPTTDFNISTVELFDHQTLLIYFNLPIATPSEVEDITYYQLSEGQVISAFWSDYNCIEIWSEGLKNNQDYRLFINQITSIWGDDLVKDTISFTYFDILSVQPKSLLFNEILYEPSEDNVEFIELFNPKSHILKSHKLQLASRDENGQLQQIVSIDKPKLWHPNTYWVLTKDTTQLSLFYSNLVPNSYTEIPLFALNNTGKTLVLFQEVADSIQIIDEVAYSPKMHHPVIKQTKNVALERTDANTASSVLSNWQSAAAMVNFATPTLPNSQGVKDTLQDFFTTNHQTISPDGDGFQDVFQLNYTLKQAGYWANMWVFDENGILITQVLRNELISTQGQLIWSGVVNTQVVPSGVYIILIELLHAKVKPIYYKTVCYVYAANE